MSLLVPPGPDQKLSKDLLKDRSFAFPLGIRPTFLQALLFKMITLQFLTAILENNTIPMLIVI